MHDLTHRRTHTSATLSKLWVLTKDYLSLLTRTSKETTDSFELDGAGGDETTPEDSHELSFISSSVKS